MDEVTLPLCNSCRANLEALQNFAELPICEAIFVIASMTCSLLASVVVGLKRTRFPPDTVNPSSIKLLTNQIERITMCLTVKNKTIADLNISNLES